MSCNLYVVELPTDYLSPYPDDPFFLQLDWGEMEMMVDTLTVVGALDFETPHPEFSAIPEFPERPPNWPTNELWTWRSDHPQVAAFNAVAHEVKRTRGRNDRPPAWKFQSTDGYVVTPDECAHLHAALLRLTEDDGEQMLERRRREERSTQAASVMAGELDAMRLRNPELEALVKVALREYEERTPDEARTHRWRRTRAALDSLRRQQTSLPKADDDAIATISNLLQQRLGIDWIDPVDYEITAWWFGLCRDFADYCERCQSLGGFEVC